MKLFQKMIFKIVLRQLLTKNVMPCERNAASLFRLGEDIHEIATTSLTLQWILLFGLVVATFFAGASLFARMSFFAPLFAPTAFFALAHFFPPTAFF
jgi:hypothetical protein